MKPLFKRIGPSPIDAAIRVGVDLHKEPFDLFIYASEGEDLKQVRSSVALKMGSCLVECSRPATIH
jgi:hypothetical protein